MKGQRVAAFRRPHPRRSLTGEGDLLAGETPPSLELIEGSAEAIPLESASVDTAWLLITAPVRRWHSRQWHMEIRDGSPSIIS